MHIFSPIRLTTAWLFYLVITAVCATQSKPALASAAAEAVAADILATGDSATSGSQILSPARCARLALDLQHIRDQFRRGYSIRQQVQLEQKQAKLRLALQYQCEPISQTGLQNRHSGQQAGPSQSRQSVVRQSKAGQTNTPQHRSKPLQISVVRLTAPYQGQQLQAWLAFYQSPFYCYNVRATERIRQCVEQRQAAQRRFERQWQRQNLSDQ